MPADVEARRLGRASVDGTIVRAAIELAHKLGLRTVAVGVELDEPSDDRRCRSVLAGEEPVGVGEAATADEGSDGAIEEEGRDHDRGEGGEGERPAEAGGR